MVCSIARPITKRLPLLQAKLTSRKCNFNESNIESDLDKCDEISDLKSDQIDFSSSNYYKKEAGANGTICDDSHYSVAKSNRLRPLETSCFMGFPREIIWPLSRQKS